MSSFEVPVGPTPEPEDEIAKRLREMQIERLRSSVASAQQQNPNRAAQALRLGLPANAPQQVIDRLMQDQARVNTEREIMQQTIAPEFWSDVDFAAIAADDPHIHKAESFWDITGQAALSGARQLAVGAARTAETLTMAMQAGSAAATAAMLKQPGEQIAIPRPSPTWVTDLRETIEESTRSWVPASGTFARDVYSSTLSSVGQAVFLGLTLGPAGILAGFGMIGFGAGQEEAEQAGKGKLEATLYGAATGSIETILSSFPVLGAFGRAAAGKGLGRNIIRTAIEEAITETATEGSQGLMRWKWLQADRSWEQVWPELSYSMQVAAAAGAFGAAATTPVFHFMQSKVDAQDQRVSQAEARGRSVNGVSDVAQQSPAVQRAPEVVGPFIDAVHEQADVDEYRIDSAKFAELVDQAGGVDAVRALVPDAVDQLLTNKGEEGTEIVLKPGEYQTTIGADAKLAALFNEHLRVGDADLSMAEAREVQATADEMVDELAKQAEEELQRKQQVSKEEGEIAEEIVAAVLGPEPTAATAPLDGLQESLAENAEAAAQQAEQIEQQQAEITPEQQQLQEQQAVADETAAELGEVPAPDLLPATLQEAEQRAAQILNEVTRQAGIDVGVVEEAAPAPQQPALPPAEVEFRQWFGRSEAVDRAGEPLVLAPATLAKSDQAPGVTAFVEVPASESGVAVSLQKPMQVTGKQAQEFITNPKAREKALQKAKDKGFDGVVVTAKTKDENKRFIRQTFYVPVDQSQVRDFATPPRTAEPEVLEAPGRRDAINIDAPYTAAVEAGDMETAQRLVLDAAKRAGYSEQVYEHATNQEFDIFDITAPSVNASKSGNPAGIYFSAGETKYEGKRVVRAVLKYRRLYSLFGGNDITDSAVEAYKRELQKERLSPNEFWLNEKAERFRKTGRMPATGLSRLAQTKVIQEAGYDGIQDGRDVAVFSSDQVKSADPITRDADGNIIPLSKRFDVTQESILYAPGERAPGQIPPGTPQPKVTRDQIRGQAKLYSAMVARLAADFEMSPKEFWQAHGPRIVSASVGVLTSEQQAAVANTTGAYVPKNLEVILTTEQTEDTLIHELSHHYLHSLIELVRAGAPDGVNTKLDNLFGFLGVDSVATWDSLPVDQKVKLHEKFAYSFTEYLATGKAPSNKLRDLFASLKQWITGFYTDVRAKLDADYFAKYNEHLPVLTPQVTAVFDSLLASDMAIERARAADLAAPLYQTRDQFQGTDQEWQDLQDLYAARDQQAADKLLARRLRDVVWTRNVLQRFAGRVSKRAKEARARISAEVEQELQAQPVYRAMRFFRRGEAVADDGTVSKFDGNHRLDLDAVRRILPDEDIDSISRGRYRAVAKKGLNPDVVANNFGYQDGETMVRELLAAPPLQEAVDAETQRRMASKHAELATPEAIQRQAAVELRSEAHARIVATELRSAAKSTQPVGVMTQAAKIAAEQAIGTMAARDVKASRFERDERRFADMAVKAMMPSVKKGQQPRKTVDDNAVTSAKRQQLLAVQMARVARAFEKELRGYRRLINRLRRTSIREQVGDRGGDVITQLLSNINLETGQPAAVVPRQVSPTDAAAWIQEKAAEGWPLNVDIAWMQSFRGTDYRDMTVADLREFMRMLQEVVHAAKQSHSEQLLLGTQTIREVRGECREAAKLNANGDFSNQRLDPTWMSGAKNLGYKAEASLITAMTKMRVMDGGKLGPWFTHIWDKASALADKKDQMIYELGERMNAITEPLRKSKFWKQKFSVPELNLGPKQLTGEELFTLLLNMGNEGNINRLLSGAQQHGWTYDTLTSAVSKLPTEAIEAAQKIWDAIAVYKPEVARLERKTKGREPNWVEPRLLNVVSSSGKRLLLRGGYYPIVYDTTRSTKSQARSEQQEADLLTRRAQARTTTTQTYTKDRVEEVDPGQFVALTLDGLFSHLEMVVHDIVWREFVIDTNRILKGGGGNSLLQDVSNSYGAAWASDLKAWLDRIADNGYKKRSDLDKLAAVVRRNVSVGALAGNIYTVVKQYGGVFYSIPRSGIVNTTHAIGEYLMNPRATHRWMLQNSPDFKLRYITRYRTSWENLLDVRNKNPKLRWLNAKLFSLIQFAQSTPDAISYLAAYKKSMLDGSTDQEAHREAYQAVAETQSSARPIDFSTLEAEASDAALTLIPFYRIANANLNLFYGSSLKNKDKQGMFGAKKALDFMIIMGVGAYMAEVFAASVKALISSSDEEQEEEEDWAWATGKEFAATTLKTTMQSIPIVNQLANVADVMFDQDFIPWRGPMGMKGIGDAESFFLQMRQAVKDDDWDKALVKSSISTLGLFYPIPTVLMRRMADTVDAYMDGDEDVNPFMILTGTDR